VGVGWGTGSFSAGVEHVSFFGFSKNEKNFSLSLVGSLLLSSIGLLHGSSYMLSAVAAFNYGVSSLTNPLTNSCYGTTATHPSPISPSLE